MCNIYCIRYNNKINIKEESDMADMTRTLEVEGMSCNHCVMSIKKAVGELEGVSDVKIDLDGKTVTVDYNPGLIAIQAVIETIEDQGYDVIQRP
jgi:copper chaperone